MVLQSSVPPSDSLIEVHLVNKSLESKIRCIIEDKKLTIVTLSTFDLEAICLNDQQMEIMRLLKEKANLMIERPLSLIQSRKLFRGANIAHQRLIFRESRGDGFDGFMQALDLVSKLQRTKKLANEGKIELAKEKEKVKYGQVAPVPSKFQWNYSWTELKHPNLEQRILKSSDSKVNYKHMLDGERDELVDHLVAELFVYFRKGIPCYYMNKVLDKLLDDFPCFNDRTTCLGYSWLRPLITQSFRSLAEHGVNRGRKRKVQKATSLFSALRVVADKDLIVEVLKAQLDTQTLIEEQLNTCISVNRMEPASLRYVQYISNLILFFRTFRQNRKTAFHQMYPRFKFEYNYEEPGNREQLALHLLHNSLPASNLIVDASASGKGLFFRMKEGTTFEDMAEESPVTGSVCVSSMTLIEDVSVMNGIFMICAINTILGIECPEDHENFLIFVEKEFVGISRCSHTSYTTQFKKSVNRKVGGKKPASRDNLDDDLSVISDQMSNH